MQSDFYRQLGQKIRALRKSLHIPLSQVAAVLNKGLSTVAKYETGEIGIDLESLCMLCAFFDISVSDLLPETKRDAVRERNLRYQNMFVDKVYVYYYRHYDKLLHKCVILNHAHSFQSTMYFDIRSEEDFHDCKLVYLGNVYYSDTQTYYVFFDTALPFDMITLNAPAVSRDKDYQIGLLSSITVYYQNMASKALIAPEPVPDRILIEKLRVTNEDIKELRRTNFFIV